MWKFFFVSRKAIELFKKRVNVLPKSIQDAEISDTRPEVNICLEFKRFKIFFIYAITKKYITPEIRRMKKVSFG